MKKYEYQIRVNGIRTVEIVVAYDQISAKKLIQARYPGARIDYISYKTIL